MDRLYLFFIASYFAQGMVGIAYEPISYLLKDGLGLSAAESGSFIAWMTLPFLLKPLLGMLTDSVPLGGRRRRPYLFLASAFTSAGWAALAAARDLSYAPALVLLTGVNVGMAFCDVLTDGIMVERGGVSGKTGLYQSAQIGTLYLTLLATGAGGGWLAEHAAPRAVFALTALFPAVIFLAAFAVEEKDAAPRGSAGAAFGALKSLASTASFWAVCLVIFLFNFTPFQGTAMFYYQSDALGFSKLFIGSLSSAGGAAGVLAAGLFFRGYGGELRVGMRRFTLDTEELVRWTVAAGALLNLLFLFYRGEASALALTVFFGVLGVLMRLSLMDLAAKASFGAAPATAFAVFMSVFNLAAWSSNKLGASLYGSLASGPAGPGGAMTLLILLSSAAMLGCWPLLRWVELRRPAQNIGRAPAASPA